MILLIIFENYFWWYDNATAEMGSHFLSSIQNYMEISIAKNLILLCYAKLYEWSIQLNNVYSLSILIFKSIAQKNLYLSWPLKPLGFVSSVALVAYQAAYTKFSHSCQADYITSAKPPFTLEADSHGILDWSIIFSSRFLRSFSISRLSNLLITHI